MTNARGMCSAMSMPMQTDRRPTRATFFTQADTDTPQRLERVGEHDLPKHEIDQRSWNIFHGWRTKVRNTNYSRYCERWPASMSKATTFITPHPQTFNVERKCRKLALRNFVPSHGLPSQSLRHTNIELGGSGGYAESAMYVRCTHARVANFCPSTVPSHRSCIDCCCDCRVHIRRRHASYANTTKRYKTWLIN